MHEILQIADVAIAIERKKIKHMYLRVRPPAGDVSISAPEEMNAETIRLFALSKLPWIQQQRQKIQAQAQVIPQQDQEPKYLTGASYFLWGDRHILEIQEVESSPQISVQDKTIQLQVRPDTSPQHISAILAHWQRDQLKRAIPTLIQQWEPIMQVQVNKFFVRQMKTKWGSCNITKGTIRLNTALAQKPKHCLEYVVVHEMNHLLERYHNQRFNTLMDSFLPHWQQSQAVLNSQ